MMDNQNRIAWRRIGDRYPNDNTPNVQYHLGDHLGSSNVAIGSTGTRINREEFAPYGGVPASGDLPASVTDSAARSATKKAGCTITARVTTRPGWRGG